MAITERKNLWISIKATFPCRNSYLINCNSNAIGTALAQLRLRKMTRELNLGQMRQLVVLIQNGKTSDYLKADNSWTTDISQAVHFPDIETAFTHMRKCGLPHLQVFVIPAPTKSKDSSS